MINTFTFRFALLFFSAVVSAEQIQTVKIEEIRCDLPHNKDADDFAKVEIIDYQKCQKDFSYALDRFLWGYQTIQSCPTLQNKAGRKRAELGKVADCLAVYDAPFLNKIVSEQLMAARKSRDQKSKRSSHQRYPHVSPANTELYALLDQYIPLYQILDAIIRYLESPTPHIAQKQTIVPRNSKKSISINVAELIKQFEAHAQSVERGVNKKENLKILKAQKIVLYLIDSLIPKVSPHLYVCACGDKRYIINATTLKKNPEKFFALFPQVLAFIESNQCAENEKKRNYSLLSKAVTGVDFKPLAQTKFNKHPQSFGPLAQKTLQELDKMTDVNSLMVGFLYCP